MLDIRIRFLLAALGFLVFSAPAHAVTLRADDVIPHNLNQLPLYGGVPITRGMYNAQVNFRNKVLSKQKDARVAATNYIGLGWTAYYAHKLNWATEHANAAWLLNPGDDNIYWLMANVQRERGAPSEEAEELYKKALSISEADRAKLTEEYDAFHTGKELVHVVNAADIIPAYLEARKQLIHPGNP